MRMVKPNEQTPCRYCAIAEGLRVSDPTEIVCPFHTRWLQAQQRERAAIDRLIGDLRLGRVGLDVDAATGVGYLSRIEPEPPKPQPVSYTDDGRPRYRDLSSPHGLTFYPDIDIVQGGSDPRLDRYREVDDNDGVE